MSFLDHYIPLFVNHNMYFQIFGIVQNENGEFNRAKLFNIGFKESLTYHDFECFIFHDVDMLLLNEKFEYNCKESPAHFAVNVSQFNYR